MKTSLILLVLFFVGCQESEPSHKQIIESVINKCGQPPSKPSHKCYMVWTKVDGDVREHESLIYNDYQLKELIRDIYKVQYKDKVRYSWHSPDVGCSCIKFTDFFTDELIVVSPPDCTVSKVALRKSREDKNAEEIRQEWAAYNKAIENWCRCKDSIPYGRYTNIYHYTKESAY